MALDLEFAKQLSALAIEAGAEILKLYGVDIAFETKDDNSPVTAADQAAEAVIVRGLGGDLGLGLPVVSEEAAAVGNVPTVGASFWLVDPLDGTKEFISRNGEFTVNIALIENGEPVLGVVYTPAFGEVYIGAGEGAMAYRNNEWSTIRCRPVPDDGLVALVSRSHRSPEVDAYIGRFDIAKAVSAGSSLKFCRVAEGAADIYPRLGRTMEWDTAAAHAVLAAAGGHVETLQGAPLTYGKTGFENPHFVAYGAGRLPGSA